MNWVLIAPVAGIMVAQLIFGWLIPDRVWLQMVHSHPWAAGFWWRLSRGFQKPPWQRGRSRERDG